MTLPTRETSQEEMPNRKDRVGTGLNEAGTVPGDSGAQDSSAREAAQRAIHEFQNSVFDLTFEQARAAYIRLLAGRGFNQTRPNAEETGHGSSSAPTTQDVGNNPNKEAI